MSGAKAAVGGKIPSAFGSSPCKGERGTSPVWDIPNDVNRLKRLT